LWLVSRYSCQFGRGIEEVKMTLTNLAIEPVLAVVIGFLILLVPRFLNYFVAVYLIVTGVLGIMHHGVS
jgi:threonine/homoserine efflux transporter RhtA